MGNCQGPSAMAGPTAEACPGAPIQQRLGLGAHILIPHKGIEFRIIIAAEPTPLESGGISLIGCFKAKIGWPSVLDSLVVIPALKGVRLEDPCSIFQICDSIMIIA